MTGKTTTDDDSETVNEQETTLDRVLKCAKVVDVAVNVMSKPLVVGVIGTALKEGLGLPLF
jgi:hypothetical protein